MGQSYDFRPWQTSLLIGAVTALSSQIYLFVFINNSWSIFTCYMDHITTCGFRMFSNN